MDLDILSWNCRGLCGDTTRRALKDLISQNKPQIVFLSETKISDVQEVKYLQMTLGFTNVEFFLSDGRSGGLCMLWNDDVKLQIGSKSLNHIDAVVVGEGGLPSWRLTGFYGYPVTADRDKSWQLLRDLSDLDSLPWVNIIGDFNEILNNSEKIGGAIRSERQMRGFRDALGYGDLLDMGFHGVMPTWGNSDTLLRLDRAVCTTSWFDIFHHAKLFHLPPSDSDHVPLLLKAITGLLAVKQKVHRFQ